MQPAFAKLRRGRHRTSNVKSGRLVSASRRMRGEDWGERQAQTVFRKTRCYLE